LLGTRDASSERLPGWDVPWRGLPATVRTGLQAA
jgi:hypothetical protein